MNTGDIRVGIGGWTFAPWRGPFYPDGLPQARELEYAAGQVTAIEINGTYYRTQSAKSFAAWATAAPDGFIFTVKASRFCTNRRVLGDAGESIERFLSQGLSELGDKLGPILWHFMPTKQFDPDDFGAFLAMLPAQQDGLKLRHALEVRHESFRNPAFVAMARKAGAAIVFAESDTHPTIADPTADFAYARLLTAREDVPSGYTAAEIDHWAKVAKSWAGGHRPDGFDYIEPTPPKSAGRDVFVFMINGAKVRAPAAAKALIAHLKA
jgi:uncharacterized protein YecE (DUF72 family)